MRFFCNPASAYGVELLAGRTPFIEMGVLLRFGEEYTSATTNPTMEKLTNLFHLISSRFPIKGNSPEIPKGFEDLRRKVRL